jgi:6,7-dimethyl-8-ribityllumazine synthase
VLESRLSFEFFEGHTRGRSDCWMRLPKRMLVIKTAPQGRPDGRGLRVAVLHSAFNASVVSGLVDGCVAALHAMAVATRDVQIIEVPGAFELPVAANAAARSGRFDAIVALGAVIRGETDHYEHVARAAVAGLASVALATGVPVALGVLTVTNPEHARQRAAAGPDNKGAEAAAADVATARSLRQIGPRSTPRANRHTRVARARQPRRAARK